MGNNFAFLNSFSRASPILERSKYIVIIPFSRLNPVDAILPGEAEKLQKPNPLKQSLRGAAISTESVILILIGLSVWACDDNVMFVRRTRRIKSDFFISCVFLFFFKVVE